VDLLTDEGEVHSSLHFYRGLDDTSHFQVSGLVKWRLNLVDLQKPVDCAKLPSGPECELGEFYK
jgi:hypothetical protein